MLPIPPRAFSGSATFQFSAPSHWGLTRKIIVKEYITIRDTEHDNIVRSIATNLGYKLDKNNSNEFIRRVLKDFFSQYSEDERARCGGTSCKAI